MLTSEEIKALSRHWRDKPVDYATTLAKCAAGLAIIAAIALAGRFAEAPSSATAQPASAHVNAQQTGLTRASAQLGGAEAAAESTEPKRRPDPDPRSVSD
jgi:hypothetical protein